ncbi:hypothetical protein AM1BK_33030 [Neobacillus kokaensis]|uniref:Uncharacterized protein n=1 Tax=Neobacillus kokaensis TaxID=2759023 RepID=A0ABQ3NA23_9BACI|nr:hypothetical protein AM1BK_33030 [Neobacillus kokaensis]
MNLFIYVKILIVNCLLKRLSGKNTVQMLVNRRPLGSEKIPKSMDLLKNKCNNKINIMYSIKEIS